VWTNDETVAAGHSIDPVRWREAFEVAMGRISGRFARVEPRRRAARLVLGLLADLPRRNCWTIAEREGESTPHGMQHLLCRASWDADAVRDEVREYVVENLHDEAAVLVVDETGDLKRGIHTVGVQRQYTGTAGRIGFLLTFSALHASSGANSHYQRRREHGDWKQCRPASPAQPLPRTAPPLPPDPATLRRTTRLRPTPSSTCMSRPSATVAVSAPV
jgi:DDE superfamily endonuclease